MAGFGSSQSLKSQIKVYCRIKPINGPYSDYNIAPDPKFLDENGNYNETEFLHVIPKQIIYPVKTPMKSSSNKPEIHSFGFARVFDPDYSQENIFNLAVSPIIESVLDGFNGTIFAYGQTGSGKTYTMTGNLLNPEDSGIIPRTINYIFRKTHQNLSGNRINSLSVSYLEIYNEVIYDLLTKVSSLRKLDDFQKVTVVKNELRNASKYSLKSEDEAYELLDLGNSNRATADTIHNQVSTRSHCIFTLYISGIRNPESNDARPFHSKLHLVDLAGSERISNQTVHEQTLNESRFINLSLTYLEQVITALNESGRSHIPYRNSMLTLVLKDSLGGNSLTTFLATISLEKKCIQETISTCRFMQRVGKVKNCASRNEQLAHFQYRIEDVYAEEQVFQTVNVTEANTSRPLSSSESNDAICGTLRPPLPDLDKENRGKLVTELVNHLLLTNEAQPILESSCNFNDLRVLTDCYTKLRAEIVESRIEICRLQNEVQTLTGAFDGMNTILQRYENCQQRGQCDNEMKAKATNCLVIHNKSNGNISGKRSISEKEISEVDKSEKLSGAITPNRSSIPMGTFTPLPLFRDILLEIGPNFFVQIYDTIASVFF